LEKINIHIEAGYAEITKAGNNPLENAIPIPVSIIDGSSHVASRSIKTQALTIRHKQYQISTSEIHQDLNLCKPSHLQLEQFQEKSL